MKFKKGDNVIVKTGKEKGKKGKIVKVLVKENRIIIEGLNMMKRHQRARRSNEKGSLKSIEMPIHVSNVMIVDPKSGKAARVGKKKVGDKWVRVSKKSNQEV